MENINIKKTVGFISLGCDKNRVDSEKMLYCIKKRFSISNDIKACEVLVINTCAFLEVARQEAIETVFEFLPLKTNGKLEKIIMCGCLPQKFIDELFEELVEVDAFLGTFDQSLIVKAIEMVYQENKRFNFVKMGSQLGADRILTTPEHYAFLKIADGCDNHCTYCLIPKIRGRYTSYPLEDLILEAKKLNDLKEIILVAQDTTRYGEDLGENRFVELIRRLSELPNISKIRILYCYPDRISDELINEFKTNEKLIKYIDIPFQHAHDRVLKLMNRRGGFDEYLSLVKRLKSEIPSIAIRSTFITGFPTETQSEHERLIEFLKEAKLFNAGFFAFSDEDGTAAHKILPKVSNKIAQSRQKELYSVQNDIAKEILKGFIGKEIEVVCDGVDFEKQSFYGRAYFNAPEIDGVVYLKSTELICQGEKYIVRINNTNELNLYGEIKHANE